jgi:hypothetical protein
MCLAQCHWMEAVEADFVSVLPCEVTILRHTARSDFSTEMKPLSEPIPLLEWSFSGALADLWRTYSGSRRPVTDL